MSLLQKVQLYSRSKSFKYGIPFLLLMVGGSFGLREFTQTRYKYSKQKLVSPEEMKKFGVTMKQPEEVTLDGEFEKVKTIDIEHWDNKRGPRPWEETATGAAAPT